MIAQLDHPSAAQLVAGLTLHDNAPRNSRVAATMREETRMEVLANELVYYMPELAEQLAHRGRERLLAEESF